MAINNDVWGTKDQWYEIRSGTDNTGFFASDFKKMSTGQNSSVIIDNAYLKTGIELDFIDTTQPKIDDSISPWNINGKSILFNPRLIDLQGEETGYLLTKVFDDKPSKMLMTQRQYQLNNIYNATDRSKSLQNFDPHFKFGVDKETYLSGNGAEFSYYSLSSTNQVIFITDFNYRNVLLYPKIVAGKLASNGFITNVYNITSYFGNGIEEYPYICGLYFDTYIKIDDEYQEVKLLGDNFFTLTNQKLINYPGKTWNGYDDLDFYNGYYSYINPSTPPNKEAMFIYRGVKFGNNPPYLQYCPYYFAPADDRFVMVNYNHQVDEDEGITTQDVWVYTDKLTKNDVLKEFAYLGFWFTPDAQGLVDANANKFGVSDYLYLPVFDNTNTTTGNYVYGKKATEQPNFSYTNNIVDSTDKTLSGDKGNLTTQINQNKAGGNRKLFF